MRLLSEKQNRFYGLVISYVLMASSLIGSFFVTPIVLNNVGDVNYGLLSFCNSITTWLILLSEALGASYVFFATKDAKENGNESITNSLFFKILSFISLGVIGISGATAAIMKLTGFQFSKYTPAQNDLIFVLLFISGANVAVNIFFSTFKLFSNYKKSFVFIRGLAVLVSVMSYLGNVLIALNTKSIILIAVLTLSMSFLSGLLNTFYALKAKGMLFSTKEKKESNRDDFKPIIKYSSIVLITIIIENLDSNLDQTLLGIMVSAESVTLYHLSITFMASLTTLSWAIVEIMRPTIYELYRNCNKDEANRVFLKICKIQSILVLFIIGGFISCGYSLIKAWIGFERIEVYFYTTALFVAKIIPLTTLAVGEMYRANNIHKPITIFAIVSVVLNLSLSILLVVLLDNKYAIWACIIGTIVPIIIFSYIVIPIYSHFTIQLPMGKYYLNLLKDLAIAFIAIVPSVLLTILLGKHGFGNIPSLLIEGFTFVIIYGIEVLIFERRIVKEVLTVYLMKKKPSA